MSRSTALRAGVVVLLAALAVALFIGMWSHEAGREAMHHPHKLGQAVRHWAAMHRVIAPVGFICLYVLLAMALLPVWWLQVLAGYAFGLYLGIFYGQIASTCAAVLIVSLAHWLAGGWIHQKIEAKRETLRQLDEMLGNNGLLVVMAVRLIHLLPFSLSNYFFGLTRIRVADAAVGTFIGGIPTTAVYVTLGADRALLSTWRFWIGLVVINLLLLAPLGVRWWVRRKRNI